MRRSSEEPPSNVSIGCRHGSAGSRWPRNDLIQHSVPCQPCLPMRCYSQTLSLPTSPLLSIVSVCVLLHDKLPSFFDSIDAYDSKITAAAAAPAPAFKTICSTLSYLTKRIRKKSCSGCSGLQKADGKRIHKEVGTWLWGPGGRRCGRERGPPGYHAESSRPHRQRRVHSRPVQCTTAGIRCLHSTAPMCAPAGMGNQSAAIR